MSACCVTNEESFKCFETRNDESCVDIDKVIVG